MKSVLEKIGSGTLFASLVPIDKTVLHTRKKMTILSGVDLKSFYHLIFDVEQKSRFVMKNVKEIMALEEQLVLHVNHRFKHKHLLLSAPLCSYAQKCLEEEGWRIYR